MKFLIREERHFLKSAGEASNNANLVSTKYERYNMTLYCRTCGSELRYEEVYYALKHKEKSVLCEWCKRQNEK